MEKPNNYCIFAFERLNRASACNRRSLSFKCEDALHVALERLNRAPACSRRSLSF